MNWTVEEETRARKCEYARENHAANREKRLAKKREYYVANREKCKEYGRSHYEANKEKQLAKQREYSATPKGRYISHKNSAKQRGVPFLLTFEEWWGLWEPHWHLRDGTNSLSMCRTGDEGGYELGNVRIDTNLNNILEYWGLL
jgi:hypothetical protein